MRASVSRHFKRSGPPIVTIIAVIVLWSVMIDVWKIPAYLLPTPGSVFSSLGDGLMSSSLWMHWVTTVKNWLLGYVIGTTAALLVAILVVQFKLVELFLLPLILALQSVPKIALAPLVFVWIGFGESSIVTMAALTSYFPTLINSLQALRNYDSDLSDLYQSLGAGRLRFLRDVKLFSAAPQIFAGMEIGLLFGLIGTVVMEFIVASKGLGYVIQSSANSADLPLNFGAILLLAVSGITCSAILRFARRTILFWENSNGRGKSV